MVSIPETLSPWDILPFLENCSVSQLGGLEASKTLSRPWKDELECSGHLSAEGTSAETRHVPGFYDGRNVDTEVLANQV